jgi:hypothetical protein
MSYNQIAKAMRKHHSNVMWHCIDLGRACERDTGLARRMAVLCETLFVRSRDGQEQR